MKLERIEPQREASEKYKPHTIYKNKAGSRVPSVTTITGELGWSTEQLKIWGNRMGLEGIDVKKYESDKADIGTLAHLGVTNWHKGVKTSARDWSPAQLEQAKESVRKYMGWAKGKKLVPVLIETPLVSEEYQFGGTMDILLKVDGVLELWDLKTGPRVYDDHLVQVGGGYTLLLAEHGYKPERVKIINIPRDKRERFEAREVTNVPCCQQVFLRCLEIYELKRELHEEVAW